MSDLNNTLTTKPKSDRLTRVLTRIILTVIALPLFIGTWIYVSPKSVMSTSQFIRYEILGERPVVDVTTEMTEEENMQYLRSLSDEDLKKQMSPEQFKRFKETGDYREK